MSETGRCDITVVSAVMLLVWYPASTRAASASHAPAARQSPQAENKPKMSRWRRIRTDNRLQRLEKWQGMFQPDARLEDEM